MRGNGAELSQRLERQRLILLAHPEDITHRVTQHELARQPARDNGSCQETTRWRERVLPDSKPGLPDRNAESNCASYEPDQRRSPSSASETPDECRNLQWGRCDTPAETRSVVPREEAQSNCRSNLRTCYPPLFAICGPLVFVFFVVQAA